ncbi:MAG: aspartyl protease family protein [Pseudomonadota bacterium]
MKYAILNLLIDQRHCFKTPSRWMRHIAQARIIWVAALLTAIGACGGGGAIQQPDAGVVGEHIAMAVKRGHASVEVVIHGQKFKFLLDSGASENGISVAAAEKLGLPRSTRTVSGYGAAGTYNAHWIEITEIQVGSARLPRQGAIVIPSLGETTPYDGLLGAPFFNAFIVQMDYEKQKMSLHSKASFTPDRGADAIPIRLLNGKSPLVNASAAGIAGWYQIDTGAGGIALTMFTPVVDKYALRSLLAPSVRMATGIGVGGVLTEGDVVRIPELRIGPYQFSQVIAELSLATDGLFAHPPEPMLGNLGAEIFRRFTVTFDYANSVMYLQPNNAFTQRFDPPRSGLVAPLAQGKMTVIQVVPMSPAAQANIQVGDVINAIDMEGQSYQTPELMSDVLRGVAGVSLSLHLQSSDGKKRIAHMMLRDLL